MNREEAIEAIKCNWPDSRYTILREALDMAISALREQDAADVAPVRHGKWLPTTKWWQGGSAWKRCSECGILHLGKSNYCPNCGCRMDGGIE